MRIRTSLIALVTSATVAVTGVGAASAAPSESEATTASVAAYADSDVVELLVFGAGPIAEANPEVLDQLHLSPVDAPDNVVEGATNQILGSNPDFHSEVTENILSGDPYAVRAGLASMSAMLESLAQEDVPGNVSANCVVWGVVNLVAVIELVVVGALVVVAAYRTDGDNSRFSRDEIAARLATLR